ncbi:MAG: hypothetical protein IKS09_09375, partial [Lachnospiraceae bacterium]|nr:hypothetical protein [Lachnospiraceae bacterium]
MKKIISMLLVCVMAMSLFAGCGGSAKKEETKPEAKEAEKQSVEVKNEESVALGEPVPASSDASGDVTIWYYWETAGHQEALDHIIQEFNGQQSNIKVQAK